MEDEIINLIQPKNNFISTRANTYYHHDVFIDADIRQPSAYRDLVSMLFSAGPEDTVHIFINSNGGQLDSALSIIEGLKHTQASVTAFMLGACHSAASIIAMHCHNVVVLGGAYMLVHTSTFGSYGNSNNVKNHTGFAVKQIERLLDETYEGFLTKDELSNVKSGVELWFGADDIRKRMVNRAKLLDAKAPKSKKKVINEN